MPSSPNSLCRDCSKRAVANGYCADHQTKNNASEHKHMFDVRRQDDPHRRLYKTKRWQGTRRIVLKRDPLCKSCGHKASTEVDHIVNARVVLAQLGIDEFFNPERCQGLCHDCHSAKTALECGWAGSKGTTVKPDELHDCSNITVVCGLPASGKSYYVEQNKQPDDAVFDYDVEMAKATGREMHADTLDGTVRGILAQRDTFVRDAMWSRRKAWVIIARRDAELTKRLEAAGAKVIELEVSESVRLQRIVERTLTLRVTVPLWSSLSAIGILTSTWTRFRATRLWQRPWLHSSKALIWLAKARADFSCLLIPKTTRCPMRIAGCLMLLRGL